jgi:5-methyltetrahydropteroyltriglutamate--homocysteine methyltransferase
MSTSSHRILTTHVGSLPRPDEIARIHMAHSQGKGFDATRLDEKIAQAVRDVVALQVRIGIDIVNDGEIGKPSYGTYVQDRLSGFGEFDESRFPTERHLDHESFPEYYRRTQATSWELSSRRRLACVGHIVMENRLQLARDLANLADATCRMRQSGIFMTAASPGVIARFHPNLHYRTSVEYRGALGSAMREEYEAIVAAGFML